MSDGGKIPRVESTPEESGSQVASCLTDGIERKRHLPQRLITDDNKYLLLDPRNQPQLLLWDAAHSNRLPKKRKLILESNPSESWDVAHSNRLPKKPKLILESNPSESFPEEMLYEEEKSEDVVLSLRENSLFTINQATDLVGTNRPGTSAAVVQASNIRFNANFDPKRLPWTSFPKFSLNRANRIFERHCFRKLRTGACDREGCRFAHNLSPNLQNLGKADMQRVIEVFILAIDRRYEFFIWCMYPTIFILADYLTRVRLFHALMEAGLGQEPLVQMTFSLLNEKGSMVIDFLKDVTSMVDEENKTLGIDPFWKIFICLVPPGSYWTTLKDLLVRVTPTILSAETVIRECIYTFKDKTHIKDIYSNYMQKLSLEQLAKMHKPLRTHFKYLLVKHDIIERSGSQYHSPRPKNQTDTADLRPSHGDADVLSQDDPHDTPSLS